MSSDNKDPNNVFLDSWSARLIIVILTFLLVIILFMTIGFYPINTYGLSTDPGKAGIYGDSFGFVNALFSGLALAGVIIALMLQSRELSLQREELIKTREQHEQMVETQKITSNLQLLSNQISALESLRQMEESFVHTEEPNSDNSEENNIAHSKLRRALSIIGQKDIASQIEQLLKQTSTDKSIDRPMDVRRRLPIYGEQLVILRDIRNDLNLLPHEYFDDHSMAIPTLNRAKSLLKNLLDGSSGDTDNLMDRLWVKIQNFLSELENYGSHENFNKELSDIQTDVEYIITNLFDQR